MWKFILYLILVTKQNVNSLWDDNTNCHKSCTCSFVHLTDTSVYGYKNSYSQKHTVTHSDFQFNNEVYYEEYFEENMENVLLKSVTCLLQTETDPNKLIEDLPKDIQSLRLIQGFESGNKTIKFNNFLIFEDLLIIELQGINLFLEKNNDSFIGLFDAPMPSVRYLNLENIHLKSSKDVISLGDIWPQKESVTFEFSQQLKLDSHPLTIIQKRNNDKEILSYKEYKTEETNLPIFVGFNNLEFLRVSNCKLNVLKWEMFEGLHKLQYLILEKNHIMFLPDFGFYGTPNLKSLSLAWNDLLNIQVTDLAGLLELEYLDMSHNNFSQLSELSLPPFPKLKLANFKDNPITAIFPSTFEVLNTTDSIELGNTNTPIELLPNSFVGLKFLQKLTLENVQVSLFKRELLFGMPNLKELVISGEIINIEFDAFLETTQLEKLILRKCEIKVISMDAFMGLSKLKILDLSKNNLEHLPPNVFDPLVNLKELYLNENKFSVLPTGIFSKIFPKLIRLNENPWHCSCHMDDWKPMIINKVKRKQLKICDLNLEKTAICSKNRHQTKYFFDNRVTPKCAKPKKFLNWSVFHVMRKQLACPEFKPKLKKRVHVDRNLNKTFINNTKDMIDLETETEVNLRAKNILYDNKVVLKKGSSYLEDEISNNDESTEANYKNILPYSQSNQNLNKKKRTLKKLKRNFKKK